MTALRLTTQENAAAMKALKAKARRNEAAPKLQAACAINLGCGKKGIPRRMITLACKRRYIPVVDSGSSPNVSIGGWKLDPSIKQSGGLCHRLIYRKVGLALTFSH